MVSYYNVILDFNFLFAVKVNCSPVMLAWPPAFETNNYILLTCKGAVSHAVRMLPSLNIQDNVSLR